MEQYFATIFENVRHERSLTLLLSLVEPELLKQSNFTDYEIDNIKNFALEKLHRQSFLKETIALDLLENQFFNYQMTTYPILNNKPEIIKIKTRDDEIKKIRNQIEKHDQEKNLKSFKTDNEIYKKKYKSLN